MSMSVSKDSLSRSHHCLKYYPKESYTFFKDILSHRIFGSYIQHDKYRSHLRSSQGRQGGIIDYRELGWSSLQCHDIRTTCYENPSTSLNKIIKANDTLMALTK